MNSPEYKNQITLGNLLPLLPMLTVIVVGAMSYASLDGRSSNNAAENARQDQRLFALESQVSAIAIAAARQDEKLVNVLGLLVEINGRLKNMEGKRP